MYTYFEKEQFKILVVFQPIFVGNTQIIYGYNFVAPLNNLLIFNLFGVKFLFSKYCIFRKQNRTAVYGGASLVLDVKLMTCYLT